MTVLTVALVVATAAAVRGLWSPCGLSMLSSLNPVSETARGHGFALTAGWYVVGAVLGGAVLGGGCAAAALGLAQAGLSTAWTWALVLVAAAVAVVSDSRVVPVSLPVHPRQVDERWLVTYRRWIYAGGYGVQIGSGFATYIMSAAVYLTAALAVLTGRPADAFAVGLVFGLARGLTVLVSGSARTPERLRALLAGIDRLAEPSQRATAVVAALAGAAAAWALAGPVAGAAAAVGLGALATAPRLRRREVPA